MRKFIKALACLTVCFSVLTSLLSCGLFASDKRSYTGGFLEEPHFYSNTEIYWVETFEEAMIAIEHLAACGNEIPNKLISSYENDEVDAKYCFMFDTYRAEKPKEGQKWYDRKYSGVSITYYGFLEELTIDELEYSYYKWYKGFVLRSASDKEINLSGDIPVYFSCVPHELCGENKYCTVSYGWDDNIIVALHYCKIKPLEDIPESFYDEFIKSLVLMGGE